MPTDIDLEGIKARKWIIRECICGCGSVDLAQTGEHPALVGIERRHRPLVENLVSAANDRDRLVARVGELEARLQHAISENLAFNVKVASEINEARGQAMKLRSLLRDACGIAARVVADAQVLPSTDSERIAAIRAEGGIADE